MKRRIAITFLIFSLLLVPAQPARASSAWLRITLPDGQWQAHPGYWVVPATGVFLVDLQASWDAFEGLTYRVRGIAGKALDQGVIWQGDLNGAMAEPLGRHRVLHWQQEVPEGLYEVRLEGRFAGKRYVDVRYVCP
jgi:hypothetical protein